MEGRPIDQIIQEDAKPPFKEELVDAGFGDREKLRTFVSDPEKIVRINAPDIERPLAELREDIKIGKALLEELRDQYAIKMPNFEFTIGYDEEKTPRVYTITERIQGKDWDSLLLEYEVNFDVDLDKKDTIMREADILYSNLLRYLSGVYDKKAKWLRDPFPNYQYTYGRRKDDIEDHLYLVDLDYHYGDLSAGSVSEYRLFFEYVIHLARMIKGTGDSVREILPHTRSEFSKFTKSIDSSDPHYQILKTSEVIRQLVD